MGHAVGITKLPERHFLSARYDADGDGRLNSAPRFGLATMSVLDFFQSKEHLFELSQAKLVIPVLLLILFWLWETWYPFFQWREGRLRHAVHNLALALFNTMILSAVFSSITVLVAEWTSENQWGLLNLMHFGEAFKFAMAVVLLDGWMYWWHRANHRVPVLWRFHRMHHSDDRMDVTTATRFHLGEHLGAVTLRLGLIPMFGFQTWHIVFYELLVIAITQFHHANISLGKWDRWLRLIVVTPDMHKIHHSRWRTETDSNYSTFFSAWDRLAQTFRMRSDPKSVEFGLSEFDARTWQTFWGMLRTPFAAQSRLSDSDSPQDMPLMRSKNAPL